MTMSSAAVITGIGVVTPAGIGKQQFWQGMCSGQSFAAPLTRFPSHPASGKVAGTIDAFQATDYIDSRIVAQTDRWTHFDLACASMAIQDAGLDFQHEDQTRIGAIFAAGTGGNEFGQKQLHLCWGKGTTHVSAYLSIGWFYAASIGQASIGNKIRGYGRNICADAAGGLMALAHAAKILAQGVCDIIIVSGSEAPITPYAFACHHAAGWLSTDAGADAYRPFDKTRGGVVLGEGGAAFCVETKAHAQARGAPIYAEISGWGQSFDGLDQHDPASDGGEYARALTMAMATAHIQPSAIDWMVCDGLGTKTGDIAEARALERTFGATLPHLPASAPKSAIGRLFNGASTVDVAMATLGMLNNTILPTVGYSQPDLQCAIDCVPNQRREASLEHVMIGARGTGGYNAALVLRQSQ